MPAWTDELYPEDLKEIPPLLQKLWEQTHSPDCLNKYKGWRDQLPPC